LEAAEIYHHFNTNLLMHWCSWHYQCYKHSVESQFRLHLWNQHMIVSLWSVMDVLDTVAFVVDW